MLRLLNGRTPTIAECYERYEPVLTASSLASTHARPLKHYASLYGALPITEHLVTDVEKFLDIEKKRAASLNNDETYAVEHALAAVRWFYRRARNEHFVVWNPTEGLRSPDRPDSERRRLFYDQRQEIQFVIGSTGQDPQLDSLITQLLFETAARRMFTLRARYRDIDFRLGAVRVYGKAHHNPLIPVSDGLLEALTHHHEQRAPRQNDPQTPLLMRRCGSAITDRKFDSIFNRVHRYAPWSAEPAITAHWFRHTTLQEIGFVSSDAVAANYAGYRKRKDTIPTYNKVYFPALREAHDQIFNADGSLRAEQQREFDTKMRGEPR